MTPDSSNQEPTNDKKILIILPAYNEKGKIGKVVEKIIATKIPCTILTVDDCSNDGTREEALQAGAEVITHKHNTGVGGGIRTGIHYGQEHNFEIGVVLSGDDQHEPSELPIALAPIENNTADFVQGSRYMEGGQLINERLFRKVTTHAYSWIFSFLTGVKITDATNGFRAFRFSIFSEPTINLDQDWLDTYELEPYLLYKAVTAKSIRVIEAPITIRYHAVGKDFTKMRPVFDWWRLARPMFMLKLRIRK